MSLTTTFFLLMLFSCKKYSAYQNNPNSPSTALPSLLLTNICITVFDYDPTGSAFASRQLTYYERGNSDVDYSWTSNDFAKFDVLRQVMKMDELGAQTGEEPAPRGDGAVSGLADALDQVLELAMVALEQVEQLAATREGRLELAEGGVEVGLEAGHGRSPSPRV